MFKRIVLAYDGSECAKHALEFTRELAHKFEAEVVVVFAFHHIPRTWSPPLIESALQAEMAQGQALIGGALEKLKQAGVAAEGQVVEGPAPTAILQVSRTYGAETIVIGSRGLGYASASILGSVSELVARGAHCPVLIVK